MIFLDNAVKYTALGGRIVMRLMARDGMAKAEIRDTGIGISEADLPHIFERFNHADRSRSRENGTSGSGLGLASGRWIAETHGGDIKLESDLSKGTSLRVRFPISR